MPDPYEARLEAAAERLGQAMQKATPEEKEILKASKEYLERWAEEQEKKGFVLDRSAFFAAAIIMHPGIQSEELIQAAHHYIEQNLLYRKARQQSPAS
jgi:hypothetical protein